MRECSWLPLLSYTGARRVQGWSAAKWDSNSEIVLNLTLFHSHCSLPPSKWKNHLMQRVGNGEQSESNQDDLHPACLSNDSNLGCSPVTGCNHSLTLLSGSCSSAWSGSGRCQESSMPSKMVWTSRWAKKGEFVIVAESRKKLPDPEIRTVGQICVIPETLSDYKVALNIRYF